MLSFAAICPHPPLLLPVIGGEEVAQVQATIAAMQHLSAAITAQQVDTILVISPHGTVFMDAMSVNLAEPLAGDFGDFGSDIEMEIPNDVELALYLKKLADLNHFPLHTVSEPLDHGAMVPLYYLTEDLPRVKACHVSFSYLDYGKHFTFGELIYEAAMSTDKRVALIASGDLSHRLTPQAPAGYSPRGREFDQAVIEHLQKNQTEALINLDSRLIEDAGECGLRSIIILLGALSQTEHEFELLSYEGPFGVGYLVGRFRL